MFEREKPERFELYKEKKTAVDMSERNVIKLPILALPREDTPSIIQNDTCEKRVGYVLPQSKKD